MSDTALIAALAVLASLVGVVIVGGSALVAAFWSRAELRARHAEDRAREAEAHAAALNTELATIRQARGNKLLARAMKDAKFGLVQAALRVRAERDRYNDEMNVVLKILDTAKEGLEP